MSVVWEWGVKAEGTGALGRFRAEVDKNTDAKAYEGEPEKNSEKLFSTITIVCMLLGFTPGDLPST
jgi:hypothetical protein